MFCDVQFFYGKTEIENAGGFGPFLSTGAFEDFYARFSRPLWSYVCHISGEASLADDLVQESFIKLVQKAPAGLTQPALRAYLFKIATSLVIDHWRARKSEREWIVASHSDESFQEPVTINHQQPSLTCQRSGEISWILSKLSPPERLLIWLAYVEGMSYREVAQILSRRETSVKVLLYRLRKKITAMLDSGGRGVQR
jgi:RNA polymerase sigma-70 factor, ECF subfamily